MLYFHKDSHEDRWKGIKVVRSVLPYTPICMISGTCWRYRKTQHALGCEQKAEATLPCHTFIEMPNMQHVRRNIISSSLDWLMEHKLRVEGARDILQHPCACLRRTTASKTLDNELLELTCMLKHFSGILRLQESFSMPPYL